MMTVKPLETIVLGLLSGGGLSNAFLSNLFTELSLRTVFTLLAAGRGWVRPLGLDRQRAGPSAEDRYAPPGHPHHPIKSSHAHLHTLTPLHWREQLTAHSSQHVHPFMYVRVYGRGTDTYLTYKTQQTWSMTHRANRLS